MAQPAYKLLEVAAAGTFGTVCIAQDLHTGSLVALKVLKQAHLHRPRVIARTRDEAVMLSRLDHPSIVQVDGLIQIGERPMVVMEWVRGISLEDLVKANPGGLPVGVAVEAIRQAVESLKVAYETPDAGGKGPMAIIHRDVKPSNMLLSVQGQLKMVDFGIARGEFEGKEAKTMSMVLGARGYLAPERLDGHDDKPSVDIYSLGICLYEFITGRHIVLSVHEAFHAEAMQKNLDKLKPEGLDEGALEQLGEIIREMCQYHEAARPDHATTVARLQAFLDDWKLQPDMEAYAIERVMPLFEHRKRTRPIDHPGYPDLAFLDRTSANCARPASPDVNAKISAFLESPDWHTRVAELERLLVCNPHWTEAPFVDALPDGVRPWWKFWERESQPEPEQVVLILQYVGRHPVTGEVRRRLLPLRDHPDPRIQQAVQKLLDIA